MNAMDHLTTEQARQLVQRVRRPMSRREYRRRVDQEQRRHDALNGKDSGAHDGFRRAFPAMRGGSPGPLAPAGLPAAAGGVDVAQALVSVVPGIRRLKRVIAQQPVPAAGGRVQLDLPKSSYLARSVIRIDGTLRVIQSAGVQTITATDPRNFIQNVTFQMSGTIQPKVLTGLQHDILDNLDVPVVAANFQQYSAGPAGAASSTTDTPFSLELTPRFSISDQNLTGIPYLAAPGTVPNIVINFANPDGTLAVKGGAGPTIQLVNATVTLEGWRIDLPSPIAPRSEMVPDGQGGAHEVTIPGQGLWQESSWILVSKMADSMDQVPATAFKKFKLAPGPNYARIVLLAYQGGSLDPETVPLTDHADLIIQQATTLESKKLWQFDNEYRQVYYRNRPKGVCVFSGIDLTGTDADLYVTGDLGNFDLDVYATTGAGAAYGVAGSKWEVLTQTLQPISSPGQYL